MTRSRDVDAEPRFPNDSDRWTDWGWPSQTPTDPYAFARHREAAERAATQLGGAA